MTMRCLHEGMSKLHLFPQPSKCWDLGVSLNTPSLSQFKLFCNISQMTFRSGCVLFKAFVHAVVIPTEKSLQSFIWWQF